MGQIYLRARFYEPEMNRFSQKDILRGSAVQPGSLNRYLYCQNDPVNYSDPSGMRQVAGIYGDGTGRTSTAKQTTPIVTKPSQNANASIPVKNRTAPVRLTDTGTGSYTSSNNAAKNATRAVSNNAINGYKGNANTPTSSGTSIAPSTARPAVDIQTALSRSCAGSRKVTQVGNQIVYNGKIYNIPSGSPVVNWTPEMVERYLNSGLPVKISLLSLTPDSIKPYQIPEIHALGAGDYSSDTKGALLMTSGIEVVAGAVMIATGAGGPIGAILLASGASSAIGGYLNEKKGGSLVAGWLGGEAAGVLSAGGFVLGSALYEAATVANTTGAVLQYGLSSFLFGGIGTGTGTFISDAVIQAVDTGEINMEDAAEKGLITGGTMSIFTPFNAIPSAISEVAPVTSAIIATVVEFILDYAGSTAANMRYD